MCSRPCGRPVLPSTTRCRASRGDGRASMGPCPRLPWRKKRSAPTRPIGEKRGSQRHLLVDGRGVPLSFIVTGANKHDVTQLDAVLQAIVVKRKTPTTRRSKHLCADAGYRGKQALQTIESHGYIPQSLAGARRPTPNGVIQPRRLGVGWWRCATAGSIAFASCSCGTRSLSAASSHLTMITLAPRACRKVGLAMA